jgi:acyl-CoA thioesterase FadM
VIDLPMADFMERVLVTRERVKFHQADPYGHLNSGEYVSLVMDHRVEALQDQLQCSVAKWAQVTKVGYVLRDIAVTYLAPAFVGDFLEVGKREKGQGFLERMRPPGRPEPIMAFACISVKN